MHVYASVCSLLGKTLKHWYKHFCCRLWMFLYCNTSNWRILFRNVRPRTVVHKKKMAYENTTAGAHNRRHCVLQFRYHDKNNTFEMDHCFVICAWFRRFWVIIRLYVRSFVRSLARLTDRPSNGPVPNLTDLPIVYNIYRVMAQANARQPIWSNQNFFIRVDRFHSNIYGWNFISAFTRIWCVF